MHRVQLDLQAGKEQQPWKCNRVPFPQPSKELLVIWTLLSLLDYSLALRTTHLLLMELMVLLPVLGDEEVELLKAKVDNVATAISSET